MRTPPGWHNRDEVFVPSPPSGAQAKGASMHHMRRRILEAEAQVLIFEAATDFPRTAIDKILKNLLKDPC